MAWPKPTPGLVISYSYLWFREHEQGREEGVKDRPCALVATLQLENDEIRAYVLPITHTQPSDPALAVEIPPRVKRALGLDADRSWVVVSEWNTFTWPGPDLRRAPGKGNDSAIYGVIPNKLFKQIRELFFSQVRDRPQTVRRGR